MISDNACKVLVALRNAPRSRMLKTDFDALCLQYGDGGLAGELKKCGAIKDVNSSPSTWFDAWMLTDRGRAAIEEKEKEARTEQRAVAAEARAVAAEKRAKRAELISWLAVGLTLIGLIPWHWLSALLSQLSK